MRILVIDDDPLVLKSLCDTLEVDGHTVTKGDGGQSGIDAFRAIHEQGGSVDVVVTDLGMPQVDGREVVATIKALRPTLPVILLTGRGQRMTSDGDTLPGVDRILGKPPKLSELRAALTELSPAR